MRTLFSNGPTKDFVLNPYRTMIAISHELFVASPYVTMTDDLAVAARNGKSIRLLVGLNVSTSPKALRAISGLPNLSIRYFTHRFHAKVYLFDEAALVGSSNLTDGGMQSNREATVLVDEPEKLQEIRALCQELWLSARVLTPEVLAQFTAVVGPFGQSFNPDAKIEAAIGRAEPTNITVGTEKKSSEYLFLEALRRRVYEQFQPAFNEVSNMLSLNGLHRAEWSDSDRGSETNRFLNWVRLTFAPGDDWAQTPLRSEGDRKQALLELGREWTATETPRIADDYFLGLGHLRQVFSTKETLQSASLETLSAALMSVHAFYEQIRFVKGGKANLANFFWAENEQDLARVKKTLMHLVFGTGDFARRLYEVLNFPEWKLRYFGESCALELSGTVKPEMCPPINGRSAKGLRFIGFDVPAA